MASETGRTRAFVLDKDTGDPVAGVPVVAKQQSNGAATTLGVLASDDAGYVSFDLGPTRNGAADRIWLEVLGRPDSPALVLDKKKEIEPVGAPMVLQVDPTVARQRPSSALPAVQGLPDAGDYVASPRSFVMPRELSVGDGACSKPVRSTLPVQTVRFVQVVRRPTSRKEGMLERSKVGAEPLELFAFDASDAEPQMLRCDILDFEQTWYDLGESLGTIVCSVPLAPCESVDIAVIEAARSDEAARTEAVEAHEELDHSLFRDRNLEETVKAALREFQSGSSFMAGISGAGGVSLGVANLSAAGTLGSTVNHSRGRRELEANSVQELHDSTIQATDLVRSLNSTVVVRGTQTERHGLETRTITNHNHCHALTIQYYEVLRRLNLATRHVRTRPGLLIPYRGLRFKQPLPKVEWKGFDFGPSQVTVDDPQREDLHLVNRLRALLEKGLLEPRLAPNFDAVRRLLFFEAAPAVAPPLPPPSSDYEVKRINVTVLRGRWGTDANVVKLRLRTAGLHENDMRYARFEDQHRRTEKPVLQDQGFWGDYEEYEDDPKELGPFKLTLANAEPRSALKEFEIHFEPGSGGSDFSLRGLKVTTRQPDGQDDVLVDESSGRTFEGAGVEPFDVVALPVEDASDEEAGDSGDKPPATTSRARDVALAWELITHLHDHRDFYGQRLAAAKDPTWFAHALDKTFGAGGPLRDKIDSLPVAVSGQHLVFAFDDAAASNGAGATHIEGSEAAGADAVGSVAGPRECVTPVCLATRGVFAEAQLSDCNACEKRDVTRFWKWEESPCEKPPPIEGVTPGFRGQAPKVEPAELPAAVVQVTQPPSAPDPVGLVGAMSLLGQGFAFRDMSGAAGLQQLLSGLSSGALGLADARRLAADVQRSGAAAVRGGQAAAMQSAAERYDNLQVAREVSAAAKGLGWAPNVVEAVTSDIVSGQTAADRIGVDGLSKQGGPVTRDPAAELAWARANPEGWVEIGVVDGVARPDILVMWNFDVGSADVSKFTQQLSRHIPMLKGWADLGDQVLVQGATSSSGTEDRNLTLGMARALAVKRSLVSVAGLPDAQVVTGTLGESGQLRETYTDEGLRAARNRRAVITRIAPNWTDQPDSNYARALALVASSSLSAGKKKRLSGLVTHLRNPSADDLYFNKHVVLYLRQFLGLPGWEWLNRPSTWAFGNPPLLAHMRDRFAILHPRASDAVLLGELESIDRLLTEGLDWLNMEAATSESTLDVFYRAIKDWVAAKQQDPTSLYYSYGAGQ